MRTAQIKGLRFEDGQDYNVSTLYCHPLHNLADGEGKDEQLSLAFYNERHISFSTRRRNGK